MRCAARHEELLLTCFYSTKDIAARVGVHPNTIRFYESVGFITPPARRANGYRAYTELQLKQCELVRLALRAEVLQGGLRQKAVEILRLCAAPAPDAATNAAREYKTMLQGELQSAKAAIASVEGRLQARVSDAPPLTRRQAAQELNVTPETLRTWERSGLIGIQRGENGYRSYTAEAMERLNIIRTLRCANYSLSAILRLLSALDRHTTRPVEAILNTPDAREDIVSVCDRLILSLQSALKDAESMVEMLQNIQTLQ